MRAPTLPPHVVLASKAIWMAGLDPAHTHPQLLTFCRVIAPETPERTYFLAVNDCAPSLTWSQGETLQDFIRTTPMAPYGGAVVSPPSTHS